jgi:hypothetical protein
MINDDFIANIPENFNQGVKYIIDEFYRCFPIKQPLNLDAHDLYIDFWGLLEAYLENSNYQFDKVNLDHNEVENIKKIVSFFAVIDAQNTKLLTNDLIADTREKYNLVFGKYFCYEFSDGDLQKMQNLINELRDIVTKSDLFTAEHQQRILKKLEKLQSELHKKVSDLDRFWGLISDAGVAIGKFGQDAKPLVDRIREIADIVWRTQLKAEELPSGYKIPLLPNNIDNENIV